MDRADLDFELTPRALTWRDRLVAMRQSARRAWLWIRFGKVTSKVMDTINGIVCEEAYYGRGGQMVGYWAYGSWDPAMPYQG